MLKEFLLKPGEFLCNLFWKEQSMLMDKDYKKLCDKCKSVIDETDRKSWEISISALYWFLFVLLVIFVLSSLEVNFLG